MLGNPGGLESPPRGHPPGGSETEKPPKLSCQTTCYTWIIQGNLVLCSQMMKCKLDSWVPPLQQSWQLNAPICPEVRLLHSRV